MTALIIAFLALFLAALGYLSIAGHINNGAIDRYRKHIGDPWLVAINANDGQGHDFFEAESSRVLADYSSNVWNPLKWKRAITFPYGTRSKEYLGGILMYPGAHEK